MSVLSLQDDPDAVGLVDRPASLVTLPAPLRYGLSGLLVALATLTAFLARDAIYVQNIALIFVLPVVTAASFLGLGPALVAVGTGVLAFDYLFTEPYYSLAIAKPAEIWATALLLIIAVIVASVAAESRRRALQATEMAERAAALQTVAHAVIHTRGRDEVLKVAAAALHRLFGAPALIFVQRDGALDVAAAAGGASGTDKDRAAAEGVLSSQISTRGETYPYDETYFDLWPIAESTGNGCVLGVDFAHAKRERPSWTNRSVEGIAGYVAAALARD